MLYSEPHLLHALLDKLADSVILYLNAQIKAGAQAVMVFDTWGGVLAHREYPEFSLRYMHKIVDGLIREYDGRRVPVTLFTKGGGLWLENIADTGCDAVGLDWTVDIAEARRRIGHKVALQGNMDPSVLYAPPAELKTKCGRFWRHLVKVAGMYLILVMVFIRMCRRKVRKCWWMRYTSYPSLIISKVR